VSMVSGYPLLFLSVWTASLITIITSSFINLVVSALLAYGAYVVSIVHFTVLYFKRNNVIEIKGLMSNPRICVCSTGGES
jgi:hypothetical protein